MKNQQKTPDQIEGWKPFWMINIAGGRPPRKKYHSLGAAVKDADELVTKEKKKAFVLECIGIIIPEGQTMIGGNIKKVVDTP